MTKDVSIHRLGPGEERLLQALCRLIRQEDSSLETCRRMLADRSNYVLAAIANQEHAGHEGLAGWALGHRLARCVGDEMLLFELDVLPPFQRRGIARALVAALADAARADGLVGMFVFTNAANEPAMQLYASTGAHRSNQDDVIWSWSL